MAFADVLAAGQQAIGEPEPEDRVGHFIFRFSVGAYASTVLMGQLKGELVAHGLEKFLRRGEGYPHKRFYHTE